MREWGRGTASTREQTNPPPPPWLGNRSALGGRQRWVARKIFQILGAPVALMFLGAANVGLLRRSWAPLGQICAADGHQNEVSSF